jgi:hypothetical protein
MNEDSVQQNAVKLMQSFGRTDICWFACPNGEQRSRMTGARLKLQGVRAGAPDLVFLIDGRFHGLELKTLTGVQSESQKRFADEIRLAGGRYHLCHGLEETARCLMEINAIRKGIKLVF